MAESAGEAHLMASLGQKAEGLDLRGGMAVNTHWAWVAAAAYADKEPCRSCNISVRRHLEAGIGYLSAPPVAPPGSTGSPRVPQWGWESYAGLGLGRLKATPYTGWGDPQDEETGTTSGRYGHAFVQTGVGKRGVWVDHALILRMVAFKFHDFSVVDGKGLAKGIESGPLRLYLEPAYTLGLGYRTVKARGQFGFSLPIREPKALQSPKAWLSLGVGLNAFGK